MSKKYNLKKDISLSLGRLGLVYNKKKEYEKSFEYLNVSLKIEKEIGFIHGIAKTLSNIGYNYVDMGKKELGKKYLKEALLIFNEINDINNYEKINKDLKELN